MRILCVGLTTVDLVQRVAHLPGPDEKVQSESVDVAAGGPAANAAVTAAVLGAPLGIEVTLVSAVGAHPLGDLIRTDLAAHGVTLIDAAPERTDPPPVSAVTVLSGTGERSIVSRNAGNRTTPVPAGGLPDADLTLVDGHHPALAVAAARSARRLLVDAGSWRPVFADILPYAEVVACSASFRHPAGAVDAPHVIVTHGPAPVQWITRGQKARDIPVPPVRAVDTAGAGDAFHGALAVSLVRGEPLPTAIHEAIKVAGVRVAHAGPRTWLNYL
ncbi:putative PfkB-family carbohydrate kinase [Actinoplanes missouriensis 431]|uniref:Putative PfkB-family carbohydrate kinase n=1 Tax=Actinoplanes missouriensis (strain ATCC 14538 / DSM 43046 / CBS 188.64 / JCM 3121 / NBRC 102363 / NCIMB 12654 / NRRL B-3342 / UNCC 431) TaxID=512565 RepID=I0HBB1_ACTM4|nr:PfkB family carbohydrate kinase [Actinoplanes missouriensis]BAL90298.1 putative PfkB-family carbohydrate kinase [Actinoplanes missouriensis 431]